MALSVVLLAVVVIAVGRPPTQRHVDSAGLRIRTTPPLCVTRVPAPADRIAHPCREAFAVPAGQTAAELLKYVEKRAIALPLQHPITLSQVLEQAVARVSESITACFEAVAGLLQCGDSSNERIRRCDHLARDTCAHFLHSRPGGGARFDHHLLRAPCPLPGQRLDRRRRRDGGLCEHVKALPRVADPAVARGDLGKELPEPPVDLATQRLHTGGRIRRKPLEAGQPLARVLDEPVMADTPVSISPSRSAVS